MTNNKMLDREMFKCGGRNQGKSMMMLDKMLRKFFTEMMLLDAATRKDESRKDAVSRKDVMDSISHMTEVMDVYLGE